MATNGFSSLWFEDDQNLTDPIGWQNMWNSLVKIRAQTGNQQQESFEELLGKDWDLQTDDRTLAVWL